MPLAVPDRPLVPEEPAPERACRTALRILQRPAQVFPIVRSHLLGRPVALAAVYDQDGARLSPRGAVSRGREAIAAEVAAFVREVGPVEVHLETVDLWIVGLLTYETGKWELRLCPARKVANDHRRSLRHRMAP